MKHLKTLGLIAVFALLLIAASCDAPIWQDSTPAPAVQAAAPTQTPPPAPTDAPKPTAIPPTATPVPPTAAPTSAPVPSATPKTDWKLADPPYLKNLPHDLSAQITYEAPPVDCAATNDPNKTCSTREGQPTYGDFVLTPDRAYVGTGDGITVKDNEEAIARRPSENAHDLWMLVNLSNKDIKLHLSAPNGSFRGFFTAQYWSKDALQNLAYLHLARFLDHYDAATFTPTPVPNCKKPGVGCDDTNVYAFAWNGSTWVKLLYGTYNKGLLGYWNQQ